MKVLKDCFSQDSQNNKSVKYPLKIICEKCKSELECDESDLQIGENGWAYVKCPLCDEKNYIDEDECHSITLTIDNLKFPDYFRHTCVATGAKDVFCEKKIKEHLRSQIDFLRMNKDEYSCGGWITGNLYLKVDKCTEDDIYAVTVSNDFYTVDIPFNNEDYY